MPHVKSHSINPTKSKLNVTSREVGGTQDKGKAGFGVVGVVGFLLTDRVLEGTLLGDKFRVVGSLDNQQVGVVRKASVRVVMGSQWAGEVVACRTEAIGWVEPCY